MKRTRFFSTLLASGWLLFAPPLTDDGKHFDISSPLSEWEHLLSYDTARECEQQKGEAMLTLPKMGEHTTNYSFRIIGGTAHGRCLPSDSLKFFFDFEKRKKE